MDTDPLLPTTAPQPFPPFLSTRGLQLRRRAAPRPPPTRTASSSAPLPAAAAHPPFAAVGTTTTPPLGHAGPASTTTTRLLLLPPTRRPSPPRLAPISSPPHQPPPPSSRAAMALLPSSPPHEADHHTHHRHGGRSSLHAFLFLLAYRLASPSTPLPQLHLRRPPTPSRRRLYCIVTLAQSLRDITPPASPSSSPYPSSSSASSTSRSGMVSYVLDLREHLLITAIKNPLRTQAQHNYIFDIKKGRMCVRMKVALALGVVAICVGVGVTVLRKVESMGWLDVVYLAVMSVTTVGYGDHVFRTLHGRLFASPWLLVSTLSRYGHSSTWRR
ncbi:hypothetical protein ZWY2020_022117 [Hordeum vulgare]|nr:hypothetical protein ZWY2020_022117 [Hordeum vulgare]